MSLQNNIPPMNGVNHRPPPSQQQQHQQGLGPQHGLPNIESVRRAYRTALTELTFNSKPIITNLTIMAQENQHAANVIVREIEQRLRSNAPDQKLPVLYLIDSICKNVGGIYISNFARNIVSTFLDAYKLTDPQTRRSFERLLQTWKNGMPDGSPVYQRHIIETIERSLKYIHEREAQSQQRLHPHQQKQQAMSPLPQGRYPPTSASPTASRNQQIHVNPNFVPRHEKRDPRGLHAYPSPVTEPRAADRPTSVSAPPVQLSHPTQQPQSNDVLSTLQSLLPAQTAPQGPIGTTDPISQILSQIQAILPALPAAQSMAIQQYLSQILGNSATIPTNPSPMAFTSGVSAPISNAVSSPALAVSTPTIASAAAVPVQTPMVSSGMPVDGLARLSHPVTSTPSPVIPAPVLSSNPPPAPVNTAELLKGLTSLGILNPTGGKPSTSTPSSQTTAQEPSLTLNSFGPFRLDSKDLQIVRPGAIELLYSGLPLQCKQCGFRYPKTNEGQVKMDAHLDSHFRQNRRMKERVKRGLSRSWFVTEDEWIRGSGGEMTSQQAPAFLNDQSTGNSSQDTLQPTAGASSSGVNPEEHMVVMPNEERKSCPICGERFVDFWNDDEEEWMYKNAIIVNGVIYHATCHADAITSGALAADKEETEDDEKPIQGVKRKAEDVGEMSQKEDIKAARRDAYSEIK